MRRFFITLVCVIIALGACLAGCSCAEEKAIDFNTAFYGQSDTSKSDPPAGYKETLTYSVSYADKYSDGQARADLLSDINFTFSDGVYVSTLETMSTLPEGIQTDIVNDLPSDAKTIYKLTTKLSIKCNYSGCTEGDGEYNDVVESTVYFCSCRLSYAPIYSEMKVDNSVLFFYTGGSYVTTLKAERKIAYNKESYTITENLDEEENVNSYDYKFATIIDNAQLLFALRNIDLEVFSYFYLPTVSYAYGEAKELRISGDSQTTVPVEIDKNGERVSEEMSLNNFSFMVNDSVKAGVPQYASVQKDKSDNLEFNSLLYSYVEPLTAYGNMLPMGYLVYTLNGVDIVK